MAPTLMQSLRPVMLLFAMLGGYRQRALEEEAYYILTFDSGFFKTQVSLDPRAGIYGTT